MTELELLTEQSKRQRSADIAMEERQWTVLDVRDGWKVKTHTDTYSIFPHPDGRLACSCPDFGRYGSFGLDCKHICGLRIFLQEESTPQPQESIQKGEIRMNTDFLKETGWVKLFHPSSAQVTIPLRLDKPILVAEAQALMASVTSLLQAGFSVDMPGLEDGEHVEEIGFAVRRSKVNTDETETPVVDLYPARGNFRLLAKYLNAEADVREFESACGVTLATLPLYEGDNSIERGKNPKMDKYVIALKHPVKVVWKLNPKYEGENDKKNSKRVFVRWGSVVPAADGNIVLSPAEMSLEDAKAVLCPMGSKSHPEFKGMTLEQVAQTEDGRKVLGFLAGDQYQPNGDQNGRKAKIAAKLLLEKLCPA
jgi:hypothetical protein